MTEVDVKGELEEGETHAESDENDVNQQIIQIEGGADNSDMVVASMLPMSSLNMEDPATYAALAQLTQAAIESAPMDESGNVILMSYEDIRNSMQEIQHQATQQNEQQQSEHTVDLSLHNIQIAQQQQHGDTSNVVAVQEDDQSVVCDETGEEYVPVHITANGDVITTLSSRVTNPS